MNKLVFLCYFATMIAFAIAQWGNQPPFNPAFPGQQNINDLCNQPGANCNIQSRFAEESSFTDHRGHTNKFTRVCDDRGCYERRLTSGSTSLSVNFLILSTAAVVIIKNFIH
ncbi:hypothetical protein PVAND_004599 [Polypedilum vanderplanki]|uniref:Uncharacterized protein n=1 Tax=Polypedilum vanderplanki TaxID=319348 RepID=A0A9J6BYL2_POLVA|nr:hypothetical protein PVAND_004599 [Polypedilum vanderplanki]